MGKDGETQKVSRKIIKSYADGRCFQVELSVILSYPDWCKVENSQEYFDFQKLLEILEKQHSRSSSKKALFEEHLQLLAKAAKYQCSGKELKAITEAMQITVELIEN